MEDGQGLVGVVGDEQSIRRLVRSQVVDVAGGCRRERMQKLRRDPRVKSKAREKARQGRARQGKATEIRAQTEGKQQQGLRVVSGRCVEGRVSKGQGAARREVEVVLEQALVTQWKTRCMKEVVKKLQVKKGEGEHRGGLDAEAEVWTFVAAPGPDSGRRTADSGQQRRTKDVSTTGWHWGHWGTLGLGRHRHDTTARVWAARLRPIQCHWLAASVLRKSSAWVSTVHASRTFPEV